MAEIRIEKLINDGRGIGRDSEGAVWMVAGVIPGEIVRVSAGKRHKNHIDAVCERIIVPAPGRRSPPCEYSGRCGGCHLQHMDDRLQAGYKRDFIAETLLRSGALATDELKRIPFVTIPAPSAFAYRQRVRLLVGHGGEIGFRKAASHRIVAVRSCPIARPALNRVLAEIAARGVPDMLTGLVREIILEESPAEQEVFVTMLCGRKPRPGEIKAAGDLSTGLEVENFFLRGRDFSRISVGRKDTGVLRFDLPLAGGRMDMVVEPGGFCQVNQEQNLELVNLVCSLAGEGRRILDLFCGAGNFSVPLAAKNVVIGSDLQRAAIRAAEINRKQNNLTAQTGFFRSAAVDTLERMINERETFDLVVLDPPRSGCRELMDRISATGAGEIIYISCDPATLARDIATLRNREEYFPDMIAAVDMFPQTRHIETVVRLRR